MGGEFWHFAKGGREAGPLSWEELGDLAAGGQIGPDDLVRRVGSADWVRAAEVPALIPASNMPTSPRPLPTEVPAPAATRSATRKTLLILAGAVGPFAVWFLVVWLARFLGTRVAWFSNIPFSWQLIVPGIAALCGGCAAWRAARRSAKITPPILVANGAAPVAAAGVALLGLVVLAAGGCGWFLADMWYKSPAWRVVCAPLLGGGIGGILAAGGLLVRAWNSPTPKPESAEEKVVSLVVLATGDVSGLLGLTARKALRDAFATGAAWPVFWALALVGAANAALVGFANLLGGFWDVVGWVAAVAALVAGVVAAEATIREAAGGKFTPPKFAHLSARRIIIWALAAPAAILALWFVIALPYSLSVPDAFQTASVAEEGTVKPPQSTTPSPGTEKTAPTEPPPAPTVPAVAEPLFTPADVDFVRAELHRRRIGQVLLQATHPTGGFVSAKEPELSLSSDRHTLVGRVTVNWVGASGAGYQTAFAFTLTETSAALRIESDTATFKVKLAERFKAESELKAVNAAIQAARRKAATPHPPADR